MTPEHDRARAAAADVAWPDQALSLHATPVNPAPWPITRRLSTPITTPVTIIGARTPAPDPAWFDDANCRGQGDLMFAESRAGRVAAIAICNGCPVIEQCAEYGAKEVYGVWAGVAHNYHRATRQDSQPRTPIAHGTPKGWKKHYDYPTLFGPACVACSQAHSRATMARKRAAHTRNEGAA